VVNKFLSLSLSLSPYVYSGEATAANLFLSVEEEDVQFEAVVRPRAQLQLARLNVERKVNDVDRTRRLEDDESAVMPSGE